MPTLEDEKFKEVAKNSKLSNILKIFDNVSETIVLIRDVPIDEQYKTYLQIDAELNNNQKEIFTEKIGEFFDNLNAKRAICELLPNYELAKNNYEEYSLAYQMQMKNLIMTFLSKIKNNNVNGTRLIDIIKELIDIFKQVKNINVMRNTDNALDSILKNTFEQKVNKFYDEINNRIKQLDRTLIGLENNNQGIKDYLIDYTRNGLRETWNIYNDSIKNEVDNIIDKYQNKLSLDIISKCKEIQDKIRNSQIKIVTLSENKDVDDFFQKFSFPEEINQNQVDELIQKIINDFFANFTNEFNCLSPEFKQEVQEYLKNTLNENLKYKINSMTTRENYLINIFAEIKLTISNPFVFELLNKRAEEIKGNLDLAVLKKQIELYISEKKVKQPNKEDFQKKLKELYEDVINKLEERKASIEKDEDIKKFLDSQLKGRTIANAMYIIKPISIKNKVVNMDNNNLLIGEFKNENRQKFNIEYDSFHKCYTIQNVENGQFLTCDDTIIVFTGKNNDVNQQWHITNNDNGGYEIILEKNKKLMQVEENANNGAGVSCQEKKGKPNQTFYFEATTKTMPPPPKLPEPPVPQVNYFPRPNWHYPYTNQVSIVDALGSVGYPNDKAYRIRIGARNNIPGTPLSRDYNTRMLNLMKEGRLIIP